MATISWEKSKGIKFQNSKRETQRFLCLTIILVIDLHPYRYRESLSGDKCHFTTSNHCWFSYNKLLGIMLKLDNSAPLNCWMVMATILSFCQNILKGPKGAQGSGPNQAGAKTVGLQSSQMEISEHWGSIVSLGSTAPDTFGLCLITVNSGTFNSLPIPTFHSWAFNLSFLKHSTRHHLSRTQSFITR